jgi:uncharacterized protein YcbK (DUF882 family)
MKLSEHIYLSQLNQPAGYGCEAAPYPPEWVVDRAQPLAAVLEALYLELGCRRMTIISGYRSPAFNEALRSAGHPVIKRSQHCEGRAADVVFDGLLPTQVYVAALHLHRQRRIRLGGLGLYAGWVHLDIRPGMLAQWVG